mgnify:FL=1
MTDDLQLRVLTAADAVQALALYNELTFGPEVTDINAFYRIIAHDGTRVFGAFIDGSLTAMLTLHLLPNATWDARPYGLIENVVTTTRCRHRGIGKALMAYAVNAAWEDNAFKVMLMTGKKRGATGFYKAAGFSSEDKTAMVIRRR